MSFNRVITGLVVLTIVVMGAGFVWLHSAVLDIRNDAREIRAIVQTMEKQ